MLCFAQCHQKQPRFRKPVFKESPTHRVLGGFIGFWALSHFQIFYLNEQLGSLLVDLAQQLSFCLDSPVLLDYLKIRKFIIYCYWSLEAVNIKKSLIITGKTNENWIKFGVGFCWVFQWVLPKRVLSGWLKPASKWPYRRSKETLVSWLLSLLQFEIKDTFQSFFAFWI